MGTIVLARGGALALRVRRGGRPVSGVRAQVFHVPPQPALLWLDTERGLPPRGEAAPVSDAEGLLRVESLAAGQVWVILRGARTVPRRVGPFSIGNDRTSEPSAIELQEGRSIHGRVLDVDGTAIGHALIRLNGSEVWLPSLEADGDGRFFTPPLPPGSYTLQATHFHRGGRRTSPAVEVELELGEEARVDLAFEE